MRRESSGIAHRAVAVTGPRALASALAQVARRAGTSTARGWRDAVYLQERLLEAERPLERERALRWERRFRGYRLVGSHLPDAAGKGVP
jgi:hypothetical protein